MEATEGAIPEKYALDNARDEAQVRMAGLAALYDGTTARHLRAIGIGDGWQCLEVGAGSPSIPTWMAERVGASGSVLVTDINTRFLETINHPRIKVKRHDIAHDPLPEDHFDLIHARLVLVWVQARDRALKRIVQSLKPGGWLVIEDFDNLSMPPDPAFDGPEAFLRVYRAMQRAIEARTDFLYGRRLLGLFRSCGLEDVGSEGRVLQWQGGSPGMDVVWSNCMQLRSAMIGSGAITPQEFDEAMALLKVPDTVVTSPVMWTVWGRRPGSVATAPLDLPPSAG
jgi:SAM-dependent methyltransferase